MGNHYTVRVLPDEEYPRLKDVAEGYVPPAGASVAVVAEKDGEIVGRMLVLDVPHIEAPYIEPEHRGGMLFARMEHELLNAMRERGAKKVFVYTYRPEMEDYVSRWGYKKETITIWSKEL